MTATTYVPALAGGAIALVAGSRALVVPPSVEHERREALASALSASGVQAVLDLLASGGLALVPPFALIDAEDAEQLHVVVRGGFAATVDLAQGVEHVSGEAVSTWAERVIRGAAAVTVAVTGATASPVGDFAIAEGTVLAASLRVGLSGATPSGAGLSAERKAPEPAPRAEPKPTPEPAPDPEPTTEPEPATAPVPVADVEATMVEVPASVASRPAAPDDVADHSTDSEGYDYLFGETMFRGVADAAVRADEPETDADSETDAETDAESAPDAEVDVFTTGGDHDGHTVLTGDIAKLRAGRKAAAASADEPPPPAPPAAPSIVLVFSNGLREDLGQPVLVGRSPSVTKVPGTRMPRLVTVGGVDQDISRNHAQFALEGGTVVVTDLHSRNGTMVAMPGREPQKLRAGDPTSVLVGTVVDLGSGITITVEGA